MTLHSVRRSGNSLWARRAFGASIASLALLAVLPAAAQAAAALSMSQGSAAPGVWISASGTGFPARTAVSVTFAGASVGSDQTSKRGDFTFSFAVPKVPAGTVTVQASGGGLTASAPFTVLATTSTSTTSPSTSTTSTSTTSTSTTSPSTTTSTTPPPTTAPPSSGSGFVGRSGRQLTLDGARYRFTGYNGYQFTTDYAVNYGCGENNTQPDLDAVFSALRPKSMVRVWAFQGLAWNKNTNTQDFTTFDRVVQTAARYNQKVIFTLANQWANCDQVYKAESWYVSGYRTPVSDGSALGRQINPLSYWDYVRKVVSRYASSTAVGMWELVNEPAPEASYTGPCNATAVTTLRTFFDTVGGEVKRLAPNHLVSSGIDLASYHDWFPTQAMPGDAWNGLQVRLDQMAEANKPLFVGEAGINASDTVSGVLTLAQRRDQFRAKMDAQFTAGIVGFIPWMFSRTVSVTDYHITPGDPTTALIRDYAL
jgi:mannan endo-1,4-beta-mannosidase